MKQMPTVAFAMEQENVERLERVVKDTGINKSRLLRKIVIDFLDSVEVKQDETEQQI